MSDNNPNGKFPWRKNVLTLVLAGYMSVIVIFLLLTLKGSFTASEAYDLIQSPLMALIGGSLAISKDLIPLGGKNGGDGQSNDRDDKNTSE